MVWGLLRETRQGSRGTSSGGGRESLEMRDEEGRVGKGGVLSCQPDLVAAIPSQRVQVAGSFHVLLHECVQCCQCGFVSLANKTSRTHLKAVHCA